MTDRVKSFQMFDRDCGHRAYDVDGTAAWLMAEVTPSSTKGYWHAAVIPKGCGEIVHTYRAVRDDCLDRMLATLGMDTMPRSWGPFPAEPTTDSPYLLDPTKPRVDDRDVYFIQGIDGGPIKIGVSVGPAERMRDIQTMSPVRLRLLAVHKGGGAALEAELHRRFASDRSHGEWFRPSAEIHAYIASLTAEVLA